MSLLFAGSNFTWRAHMLNVTLHVMTVTTFYHKHKALVCAITNKKCTKSPCTYFTFV